MSKIYGIDIGSTYAAISALNGNGIPEIIDNFEDDSQKLACAVYFDPTGEIVVGESAKSEAEAHPDRVVQFFKREIGREDVIVREFEGFEDMRFDPITITALILRRLKSYVEEQGEDEVRNVIISCPDRFDRIQRLATEQAANMAGMNVIDIINDSTSAAVFYCGREYDKNLNLLVYDLGGGTFSLSLLNCHVDTNGKTTVELIDHIGDSYMLGGVDWDERLYSYICDAYCEETGKALDEAEIEIRPIIMLMVESIKKRLSRKPVCNINLSTTSGIDRIEITSIEFENRTRDLVERTIELIHSLLKRNDMDPKDMDAVLLVGGSTKMPMIRESVEALFPDRVRCEKPDLVTAMGNALWASQRDLSTGRQERKKWLNPESNVPSVIGLDLGSGVVAASTENGLIATVATSNVPVCYNDSLLQENLEPVQELIEKVKRLGLTQLQNAVISYPVTLPQSQLKAVRGILKEFNILGFVDNHTASAVEAWRSEMISNSDNNILVIEIGERFASSYIVWRHDLLGIYPHVVDCVTHPEIGKYIRSENDSIENIILAIFCDAAGIENVSDVGSDIKNHVHDQIGLVKKELAEKKSHCFCIIADGKAYGISVSASEIEEQSAKVIEYALGYVKDMLRRNMLREIDAVILVGKSVSKPSVLSMVSAEFPCKVICHEPNEIAAKGAATVGLFVQNCNIWLNR